MPTPTRTRRRYATDDAARYIRKAEDAALITAARDEMDDPESPILALLAAQAANPDGSICPRVLGYSLRNRVLLVQQATQRGLSLRLIGTYSEWHDLGRPVRFGQTGLRVHALVSDDDTDAAEPETADQETDEQPTTARPLTAPARTSSRMLSLFSVDQTAEDGADEDTVAILALPRPQRPKPTPPSPQQRLRAALAARLAPAGYTVATDPAAEARAVRIDPVTHTVYVPDDLTAADLHAAAPALAALIRS